MTFAVISFISADMKEAFKIVELTKDKTIRITFGKNYDMKEERRNLIGYTLNFIVWFADVLLYCDSYERKVLITSFTERADIIRNEHVQELLKWLIIDQEVYGKTDEFWSIWELLKSKMIELGIRKSMIITLAVMCLLEGIGLLQRICLQILSGRKIFIVVICFQRKEPYF